MGSCIHHARQQMDRIMLANNKDFGFWHLLPEKPGDLQSIHARHADVEKDQVGLEFPGFY
jgi:hypothetical protein